MLTRGDLAELKRRHPLPGVVAGYGVELRPCGQVFMARCPFHDDHEPSLLVDPRDGHYHCFGCRAHGDLLDFIQRIERVGFRQAVERLAGRRALPAPAPIPPHPPRPPSRRRRETTLGAGERPCLAAAAMLYHRQLLAEPNALAYLAGRGLAPETIARHRLGYAGGGTLLPHLGRLGLPLPAARRAGLVDRAGRERLAGRVVIPELRAGRPIWLIGRALGPGGHPRYLGLPGTKPLLGWEAAASSPTVFLTEGPFDWLALRRWGYPALALVGTHPHPEALDALRRFERIYLALDGDAAGLAASEALRQALDPRAVLVRLPGAKDVAELAAWPDGRVRFAAAVEHAALPRAA